MAYSSCAADLAANIAMDCAQPIVGGYTGRAVLVQWEDAPIIVQNANNPRKITSITLGTGVKTIVVDNAFVTPFDGSQTSSNTDSGRVLYGKQLLIRVPKRGADASKNIIEPLHSSAMGFLAVVEKKDKTSDGAFEVIGYCSPLKATGDGTSRNENENGGDTLVKLECFEPFFELDLVPTGGTYADGLTAFETLIAAAV